MRRRIGIEYSFFEKMIQAVIVGGKEEIGRHNEGKLAVLDGSRRKSLGRFVQ